MAVLLDFERGCLPTFDSVDGYFDFLGEEYLRARQAENASRARWYGSILVILAADQASKLSLDYPTESWPLIMPALLAASSLRTLPPRFTSRLSYRDPLLNKFTGPRMASDIFAFASSAIKPGGNYSTLEFVDGLASGLISVSGSTFKPTKVHLSD